MDGGKIMDTGFEITALGLQRMIDAERRELEGIHVSVKKGSGEKPEYLKAYNKYMQSRGVEPVTTREYLKDDFDRDEVKRLEAEIEHTVAFIKRVFDVELSMKEAATISHSFYQEGNPIEEILIAHYNKVLHIIQKAHTLTDARIKAFEETLTTLGASVPSELQIAKYVRSKYKANQLRRAVTEAVTTIFPTINNKNILDQIAVQALQ